MNASLSKINAGDLFVSQSECEAILFTKTSAERGDGLIYVSYIRLKQDESLQYYENQLYNIYAPARIFGEGWRRATR